MTPKEKAKELIYKFADYSDPYHYGNPNNDIHYFKNLNAKRCALICLYEISEILNKKESKDLSDLQYWGEVQYEINKL